MKRMVLGFAFCKVGVQIGVLLIKKDHPDWMAGKLNGIGGHCEPKEKPHDAMAREFEEECGVKTSAGEWVEYCTLSGDDFSVSVFRAELDEERFFAAKTMTSEEVGAITIASMRSEKTIELIPNVRWLIEMGLDSRSVRGAPAFFARIEYQS